MKPSSGVEAFSISIGSRQVFETRYYGAFATYKIGDGRRRFTLRPLADRKAREAIAVHFKKREDQG